LSGRIAADIFRGTRRMNDNTTTDEEEFGKLVPRPAASALYDDAENLCGHVGGVLTRLDAKAGAYGNDYGRHDVPKELVMETAAPQTVQERCA
jgi:hypothetical protein